MGKQPSTLNSTQLLARFASIAAEDHQLWRTFHGTKNILKRFPKRAVGKDDTKDTTWTDVKLHLGARDRFNFRSKHNDIHIPARIKAFFS